MKSRWLVGLCLAVIVCGTAEAGLVLNWKLDESAGATTFREEVSGQTTTAVSVGPVSVGVTGLAPGGGNAIDVGIDSSSYINAGTVQSGGTYVAGSDADYRILSNNWTVAGWIEPDVVSGGDYVAISSDWNSTTGWMLGVRGSNLFFDFGSTRSYGQAVAADTPYFVAVLNDSSSGPEVGGGTNKHRFAVWDGTSWSYDDDTLSRNIRLQGLEIGSFNNGTREFNGTIDDVRIYDHTLSQAELDAIVSPSAIVTKISASSDGPNGSHDTWNNPTNWDNGIPSGPASAVVGTGITAQVWNSSTPAYSGSLTLEDGATLQLGWTTNYPENANALGGDDITMGDGSVLRLRLPFTVNVPPTELTGNATIELSPSTSAHHTTRDFDTITGPGLLTLIGNNNNTAVLDTANPSWSGGFIADALDGWRVDATANGAFGTGDVTFNARVANDRGATLRIGSGLSDVIADTASLYLNGPRDNRLASKLILGSNETVGGFWLDGTAMAPGDYDASSGLVDVLGNPLITGNGILTVLGGVLPPGPGPELISMRVDFNSNQNGGGDSTGGDPQDTVANHNQSGWWSYHANHEAPGEFTTATYPNGVTVTPAWPNTTSAAVQQSIDRNGQDAAGNVTGSNDNTWAPTDTLIADAGDLNLVTDWLGIDTRSGNGNWDGGDNGTPTYMTLTLCNLPAGEYEWVSYHHDTENGHTFFQIEISTDGGVTFTNLGQEFYMTDGTDGGTPDSATDGAPWGPIKGDLLIPEPFVADNLPSTIAGLFFVANGTDDVILRFAPLSGTFANSVHNQIWGINGFKLTQLNNGLIPEPGSMCLLGLGLAALARRRRRDV